MRKLLSEQAAAAEQQAKSYSTLMLYEIANTVEDVCDNTPTVEPKKVLITNVTFDEEKLKELTDNIVERIKSGEIVLQDERPKGEWIYTDNRWGLGDWECDNCHKYSNKDTNFCPNCGADMRGDSK